MIRREFLMQCGTQSLTTVLLSRMCFAEERAVAPSRRTGTRHLEGLVSDQDLDTTITRGLRALVSTQHEDGSWEGWTNGAAVAREDFPLTPDGDVTWSLAGPDIGATSFAALALLRAGRGEIIAQEPFYTSIRRAARWLVTEVERCPNRPGAWLGSRLSSNQGMLNYGFSGALGTTITTHCLRRLEYCWPRDDNFLPQLQNAVTKAYKLLFGIQSAEGEWNSVTSVGTDGRSDGVIRTWSTRGQETVIGCQALEGLPVKSQYDAKPEMIRDHAQRLDLARNFIANSQRLKSSPNTYALCTLRALSPLARAAQEMYDEAAGEDRHADPNVSMQRRLEGIGVGRDKASVLSDSWKLYHGMRPLFGHRSLTEHLFDTYTLKDRLGMQFHHLVDALACWPDDDNRAAIRLVQTQFARAQLRDGSWSDFDMRSFPDPSIPRAHPALFTATAILALTADRDRSWMEAVVAAERKRFSGN